MIKMDGDRYDSDSSCLNDDPFDFIDVIREADSEKQETEVGCFVDPVVSVSSQAEKMEIRGNDVEFPDSNVIDEPFQSDDHYKFPFTDVW